MHWQTSRFAIDLSAPKVMGIVNVTPDSFSDGGTHTSRDAALRHCERLLKEGADILDIGGESTRPGAFELPVEEELERVLPIVRHAVALGVPVSVDTYKPQVMQAVLDLGADVINDIWALRQPGALATIAAQEIADCIGGQDRARSARGQAESWAGAPLYFLQKTPCPAVILEPHFGCTADDHLASTAARDDGRLAAAIARAVHRFLGA